MDVARVYFWITIQTTRKHIASIAPASSAFLERS